MQKDNKRYVRQATILVAVMLLIFGFIFFTRIGHIDIGKPLNTLTGLAIYDLNPDVSMAIPDVDLNDQYGYSTGHKELTERQDSKFDITLSSSPGIPNLVHVDEIPEAVVEIKGYDSGNESVNIKSVIDTTDEDSEEYGYFKSSIFAIDSIPIESATITLPKTGHVEYILQCDDFDIENFKCLDANGWWETDIPFTDNGDTITFTVTHFSGYAGGGSNATDSANLTIWDNTDPGMFHGDQEMYPFDTVESFANYSMLNGSAIPDAYCEINFSDGINAQMNFIEAYQLYEYDRMFNNSGNFSYNVSCDGSLSGFVVLNTSDNIIISGLIPPPQGQGGDAPSVTVPLFNTTSVNATDDVNASVTYSDAEADAGTLYFNWYVNRIWVYEGVVAGVANGATVSLTLKGDNYTSWDNLTVQVTPYDGTTNGTAKNSTSFFQICLNPSDNLNLSMDTILCPGSYNLTDGGGTALAGVIIANASSINITCDNTMITGAASGTGIRLINYDFVTVKGCTIARYGNGMSATSTGNNNTFINNSIQSCTTLGLDIDGNHNNVTNNTFFNNSGTALGISGKNTLIWGNLFFGNSNNEGISDSGSGTNLCVNNNYGNFYDNKVTYSNIPSSDCGPTPNASILLYDKSENYNWSWGSTGVATYNNLGDVVYNTKANGTIIGAYYSGVFYLNDSDVVRDNITLNCNGTVFDDKATGETAMDFTSIVGWTIKNCTFIRYSVAIDIGSASYNNTIINTTVLSSTSSNYGGISVTGDHNNITNCTFYNNTGGGVSITAANAINNFVWGNRFLGNNNDGLADTGTSANICVNNLYGNYYDINVPYTRVAALDCGPTPNATVLLYDKSEPYNWSWGSTGVAAYNNLGEATYNIKPNGTIVGAYYSGVFYLNDTDVLKDNITLDCNGTKFDDKATDETGIDMYGAEGWTIKNCTFISYSIAVKLQTNAHNNTFTNNTFMSSPSGSYAVLGISGDHNNITNNTFFNNTKGGLALDASSQNNLVWGNRFLGIDNDGVNGDTGTNNNFCVNDLYGNYYNGTVSSSWVLSADCGPSPNATIYVDKTAAFTLNWGGNVTVKYIQEGIYNTFNGSAKLLEIVPGTGPYNQTFTSLRNNIKINCSNNTLQAEGTGTGFAISGEKEIVIHNCTFNNFNTGIDLSTATANKIYNNTFMNNDNEGILFNLGSSNNNIIKHNNFSNNNNDAIEGSPTSSSSGNNITENTFDNNTDYAITLNSNMDNTNMWRNNIRNNRLGTSPYTQAENPDATTSFNISGMGNYWSDYDTAEEGCIDINHDGFCDLPQDNITSSTVNDSWPYVAFIDFFEPSLSLSTKPTLAYSNTTLNATINYTDGEGDTGTIFFDWFVNGTWKYANITTDVAINTNASHLLQPSNFSKWSNVTVQAMPFDGTWNGTPRNISINISNSLPEKRASIISPSTAFANETINATFVTWDIDGDTMTAYFNWYVNGTSTVANFTSGLINNTNISSSLKYQNYSRWSNVTVMLTLFDGAVNSTAENLTINISNSLPEKRASVISPSTAFANETINATFVTWDIDGDTMTAYFNWYVNGTSTVANFTSGLINNTNISSSLKYQNYSRWSNVTVMLTLFDGAVNSTAQNLTINISNKVPEAINPVISPASPLITERLNATLVAWDLDSDAMTVYIDWFVNNTINVSNITANVANGTNVSAYLGTGNYTNSNNVTFQVVIFDGYANSTPINSSYVSFSNAPPSLTLSLKPTIAYVNTSLNATVNYTDANDDVGTVYFDWYVNSTYKLLNFTSGIVTSTNVSSILKYGNFSRWSNVTVQATPNDGYVNGTPVNVSVNITNLQPSQKGIALSPDTLFVNTSNLNATALVVDDDQSQGTALTAYFDWFVNNTQRYANYTSGLTNSTNISAYLMPSNFSRWSNITVQLVVYDGSQNSSPVNATQINVSNSLPFINLSQQVSPANCSTTQINGTFIVSDSDFDVQTIYLDWFVASSAGIIRLNYSSILNNINIGDLAGANLSVGNFTISDNVTLQMTAYDGIANSTPINATRLKVLDCSPAPTPGGSPGGDETTPETPPEVPKLPLPPPICESSFSCSGWSSCADKLMTRTCTRTSSDCTSNSYKESDSCCSTDKDCRTGYYCMNSKCELASKCVDSDGSDTETFGSVTYTLYGTQETYDDRCIDRNKVLEYSCVDEATVSRNSYPCRAGCVDGRCLSCTPEIQCREWGSCERQEQSSSSRTSGSAGSISYLQSRSCTDLNRCVGEYLETKGCCPGGIVGRATGQCENICEASESCTWSSCTGGIRTETCTRIDETCIPSTYLGATERCRQREELPARIEETVVELPTARIIEPSALERERIMDRIRELTGGVIRESVISDQNVREHTVDTIRVMERDSVKAESADEHLAELGERSELGHETSIEATHTLTSITVEKDGVLQDMTAVTVAFSGDEMIDEEGHIVTDIVKEVNDNVDASKFGEITQDIKGIDTILQAKIADMEEIDGVGLQEDIQGGIQEEMQEEAQKEILEEVTSSQAEISEEDKALMDKIGGIIRPPETGLPESTAPASQERRGLVVKADTPEKAKKLRQLLEKNNIKVSLDSDGNITYDDVKVAVSKVTNTLTKPVIIGLDVSITEEARRAASEGKIKLITVENPNTLAMLLERYKEWLVKVETSRHAKGISLKNVKLIEYIPKSMVDSASEISFVSNNAIILQDDPIIEWDVGEIKPGEIKEYSYIVKRRVTKLETISVVSGEFEDRLDNNINPCSEITYSDKNKPISAVRNELNENSAINQTASEFGYEVIVSPFSLKCGKDNLDFTINIPENYGDVKVLKCTGADCKPVRKETLNELTCGRQIVRETVIDEEFKNFVPVDATQVSINVTEFKDALVSMNKEMVSYDEKIGDITLDEQALQPKNPSLKIIGAPVRLRIDTTSYTDDKVEAVLPLLDPIGFENDSFALYLWTGKDEYEQDNWMYLNSSIDHEHSTISSSVDHVSQYLDNNSEMKVAMMGIVCLNCLNATLEKAYIPQISSRNVILLVHGLASSPATFEEILKDIKLTDQPFQAWTFGYPTTDAIEKNAKELAGLIEEHESEFDSLYIAAHSLGGLVSQQALYYAYLQNLQQPGTFKFLDKVKRVVVAGSPNEGTPGIEPFVGLFQYLINLKAENRLFNVNSNIVATLAEGVVTPQIPSVEYYVISGAKSYPFSKAFFEKEVAGKMIVETNDGIVGVKSAQRIGDEYINQTCVDYWQLGLTHTELINNPIGRKQIEKIVAEEVLDETRIGTIMGHNQFFQFHISECSGNDMYMVIGKELEQKDVIDPAGCKCGDNYCAWYENYESCPQDCPKPASGFQFGKTGFTAVLVILALAALLIVGSVGYVPIKVYRYHVDRKHRMRHMEFAKDMHLEEYVHAASKSMHLDQLKQMLLSKGWHKDVVHHYVEQAHKKRIDELRNYASALLARGVPPLKIRQHLVNAGWHHAYVDRMLGVSPQQLIGELRRYVEIRLSKGHDKFSIREDLIRTGWHNEQIDRLLNIAPQEIIGRMKSIIEDEIRSGKNKLLIREELVTKHWDYNLVEQLLGLDAKEEVKELTKLIKERLKKGESRLQIRAELVSRHWNHELIEHLLGLTEREAVKELTKLIKERLDEGESRLEIRELFLRSGWSHALIDQCLNVTKKDSNEMLKHYIEHGKDAGLSNEMLKKRLIRKGWASSDIERFMRDDELEKIELAKDYAQYELFQGFKPIEIRQRLIDKHWDVSFVDHLLGITSEAAIKALIEYVQHERKKGKTHLEIRESLLKKGWGRDIADKILGIDADGIILIVEYVQGLKKKCVPLIKIREALLKKGWDRRTVDDVLHIKDKAALKLLNDYIYYALKHDHDKKEIIKRLEQSGWKHDAVRAMVNDVITKEAKPQLNRLMNYILAHLNAGIKLSQITSKLLERGWKRETTSNAINAAEHILLKNRTDEIKNYAALLLQQGHTTSQIKAKLLKKGWPESIVDGILKG